MDLNTLAQRRSQMQALARELVSVFQPIVDLRSGHVVGVEALARFRTEHSVSPADWFSEAWDLGLGLDVELAAARAAMAAEKRVPRDLFVAVNFSVRAILAPEFRQLIRPLVGRVVVELTEHARVQDYDALEEALEPLRAEGLKISVDDVGAGFSSLRHILRLKPDIMKLDSTLTRGVHQDRATASLTRGLVEFARTMDIMLVAEGIESQIEEEALLGLGITLGQGYYLGLPQPFVEATIQRPVLD